MLSGFQSHVTEKEKKYFFIGVRKVSFIYENKSEGKSGCERLTIPCYSRPKSQSQKTR